MGDRPSAFEMAWLLWPISGIVAAVILGKQADEEYPKHPYWEDPAAWIMLFPMMIFGPIFLFAAIASTLARLGRPPKK